jgi:hypothetical protein
MKAFPCENEVTVWIAAHTIRSLRFSYPRNSGRVTGYPETDHHRGGTVMANGDILCGRLFSQQQVGGYENEEDYRDYAVHGEEGGVQFAEIVGGDQRVLVSEQQGDSD